ncbi:hypothetical protein KC872_04500 [Candidatus Kaiserbacteria bacterium]|nr:hypothetical protein [Candidatus Kaiserbacteria bacterium]
MGNLWGGANQFLPQIAVAVLVLIVGWIIGGIAGGAVRKLFRTFKINEALDKAGVDELSKKAGHQFLPGNFVGALVKWFVILAFAMVAFDILGLSQVNVFMHDVVFGYLPKVFAAVLILFAAVVIASLARTTLEASLRASGGKKPELFGRIAYYLVIAFAIMAALNQLEIADELVNTLFTGIVFALALATGLAFGLGGKDAAARYIDDVTKKH